MCELEKKLSQKRQKTPDLFEKIYTFTQKLQVNFTIIKTNCK